MFREVSAKLAVAGILSNTVVPSRLNPILVSQTFVILAEEIRNLTPSASGEPLGGPENGEYGRPGGVRAVQEKPVCREAPGWEAETSSSALFSVWSAAAPPCGIVGVRPRL